MDKSLCLLITRCVVKTLAFACMIAGVAAAQASAEFSSGKLYLMLTTVKVKSNGFSSSVSLDEYTDLIGCEKLADMFYPAFAMGIIAIVCGVAGIVMGLVNKFVGNKIPSVVFVDVAGLATVVSLIGLSLIIAALNGESCVEADVRNTVGKYDGGFAMYIVACFFILADLVVEILAMLGLIGGPSEANQTSTADEEANKENGPSQH